MALILNGECGTFNPVLVECLKDIQNELAKGRRIRDDIICKECPDDY